MPLKSSIPPPTPYSDSFTNIQVAFPNLYLSSQSNTSDENTKIRVYSVQYRGHFWRAIKFTVTWCFWWEDVNRYTFLCKGKSAIIVFNMLGATTQNLVGWATGHVGFVQHYIKMLPVT